MKKFFKIYTGIFIFLIIFGLSASLLLSEVSAADVTFKPQVPIGGFTGGSVEGTTIGNYIKAIYVYAISAVGILAAFMVMFNAFNWVISAGNQEKIKEAQSKIVAALSGLVLVLFAYALFSFINPDLVNFKSIEPKIIEPEEEASSIAEDRYKNCSWDVVYTCASGRTQSDGKCPEETKPAEPMYSICCCEITPLDGCSWTNLYNCSNGTTESDENNCGSKSTDSQTCCCAFGGEYIFDPGIEQQLEDASAQLTSLLSCMRANLPSDVGRISSISDSAGLENCIGDNWSRPPCAHTEGSCHYGGETGGSSMAVDFGDDENASTIRAAYDACSAYGGAYLNEGDHIHISTQECPGI